MYHKPRFTDTYMLFTAHCLRLNADLDSNNLTEMAKKIFNVISVNRVILAYGTAILKLWKHVFHLTPVWEQVLPSQKGKLTDGEKL